MNLSQFKSSFSQLKNRFGGGLPKGLAPFPKIPGAEKWKFKFNPETLYRKAYLYNSLAIVICTYFVADLAVQAINPFIPELHATKPRSTAKSHKDLSLYDGIYARNLFNEKGLIPDADESHAGSDGPPVKTSLPINLMGVIVVQDELKSVASIEDKGANQVIAVRVNDSISPSAVVQKIETTKVIFYNKNTGRREFIDLPQDTVAPLTHVAAGGIQKTSESRYLIDRQEVDKTLGNINEVLTQARCVPNFEGGRAAGYRCFQIVPGSIYDKLGMKDNDVICGINGQSINDPGKAFEVFGQLKTMSNIDLCINRGGKILNVSYDIN